jgi:hypothetical protein
MLIIHGVCNCSLYSAQLSMEPAQPHATLALDTDPIEGDESDQKSHEAENGGEKDGSKASGNTTDSVEVTATPNNAPRGNSSS